MVQNSKYFQMSMFMPWIGKIFLKLFSSLCISDKTLGEGGISSLYYSNTITFKIITK